jgi:hypothetical protein
VQALAYSALATASALYAAGCGGDSHSATATTLHDALIAPDATVLEPGEKVDVSRQKLSGVGWQVSCVDGDRRVNAEALRGQRTGSGRIISYAGGSPSLWVKHHGDGSITITCR